MKRLSIIFGLAIGSFLLFAAFYTPLSLVKVESATMVKKRNFKKFLNNFEEIQLPYNIDQDAFQEAAEFRSKNSAQIYNSERRISKDFKAFVPGVEARFSRSGPSIYLYEAILAKSNTNATVLYSIHHPYHQFPQYMLVTYNSSGKILEETIFANRTFNEISLGSIDKKKNIVIKTYDITIDDTMNYRDKFPDSALKLKEVITLKVEKNGKLVENATASL